MKIDIIIINCYNNNFFLLQQKIENRVCALEPASREREREAIRIDVVAQNGFSLSYSRRPRVRTTTRRAKGKKRALDQPEATVDIVRKTRIKKK